MGPDGATGELIRRDGVTRVAKTVLASSHWAWLFADTAADKKPDWENEKIVPGYGATFAHDSGDRYFTPDQLAQWWDSEYVYLVNPEGEIRWAALGVGHDDLTWESLQWRTDVPEEARS